jgi:3-oxoacyl-[acyl-carrier protein] reductase
MDFGLKNKNCVVTGGTHGIGLEIAKHLARAGCNIAVCSSTKSRLDNAFSVLNKYTTEVLLEKVDVLKPIEIDGFCKKIISNWKRVDILINNVGGGGRWGSEIVENTSDKVWREVYEKNAFAAIKFTKYFLPIMKEHNWGRVITIASRLGKEGGGRPWFNMAKSAQISFMKTMAMNKNYSQYGITFNTVSPGSILIENTGWAHMRDNDPISYKSFIENNLPLGRLGTSEEVASIVLFLCSKQASLVNGSNIAVDGGESSSF